MHLLHLLRHAKSSLKDDVDDHERRLSRRGREAAQLVAQHLPGAIGKLDLVLCSSAMRTRETLELVLVGFQERPLCVVEDNFYLAECRQLIARLQRLEESFSNVLLIGHNPGLHQLAIALAEPSPLARSFSNKFPTLARASYRIGTEWSRIGDVQHRLMGYATPLSLSERRD